MDKRTANKIKAISTRDSEGPTHFDEGETTMFLCVSNVGSRSRVLHMAEVGAPMVASNVTGWFPIYDPDHMRIVYLQDDWTGRDRLWMAFHSHEVSVVSSGEMVEFEGWSGPPLGYGGDGGFFCLSADERSIVEISYSGGVSIRGSVGEGEKPVCIRPGDDVRFMLLRELGSSEMRWVDAGMRDIHAAKIPGVYAASLDNERIYIMRDDPHRAEIIDLISGEVVSSRPMGDGETGGKAPDWWRPMISSRGHLFLTFGTRTTIISSDLSRTIDVIDAIHPCPITPVMSRFETSRVPKRNEHRVEPPVKEAPRKVVIEEMAAGEVCNIVASPIEMICPSSTSSKMGRAWFYDSWWSRHPWLFLSSASWRATGANQRPVAICRELAKMGNFVIHYSPSNEVCGIVDGVLVLNNEDIMSVIDQIVEMKGVVISTFGSFSTITRKLHDDGWMFIYDMIDDWDALGEKGFFTARSRMLEEEDRMIGDADVVLCSAETLEERAKSKGAFSIRTIRNGGISEIVSWNGEPVPGMISGEIQCVYCGMLDGPWFSWGCIDAISRCGDIALNVIGGYAHIDSPNIQFLGEMPFPRALRYISASTVGIIPFQDAKICHGVDPIKAYDYWSCGCWVVATPDLTPMRGRPYTIFADPEDFPEAIREANHRRVGEPVDPEFVRNNSWSSRSKDIVSIVRSGGLVL